MHCIIYRPDLNDQRIRNYSLEVLLDQAWVSVPPPTRPGVPWAAGCKGQTVGTQLIDLLPAEFCRPSEVTAVRVRCLAAAAAVGERAAAAGAASVRLLSVAVHQTVPPAGSVQNTSNE
jgi:hypothetical protein